MIVYILYVYLCDADLSVSAYINLLGDRQYTYKRNTEERSHNTVVVGQQFVLQFASIYSLNYPA
jgi:hypothetical protein